MSLKHGGTLCALACATAAMMLFTDETSAAEKEPVAVLELGAAGAWDLRGGSSFGPAVALEFEPVKDNLVIEAGLAPLFDRSGHADWDFDLLFRRPFDLSKKVEFEPGVGPTFNGSGQVGALFRIHDLDVGRAGVRMVHRSELQRLTRTGTSAVGRPESGLALRHSVERENAEGAARLRGR